MELIAQAKKYYSFARSVADIIKKTSYPHNSAKDFIKFYNSLNTKEQWVMNTGLNKLIGCTVEELVEVTINQLK